MNKFALGAATALALAIPATAALAQQLSPAIVAVVDTDRIVQQCTACVAASQQLRTQLQQVQQREQQLSTPLQTEGQALQTAVQALPAGQQPDAALQQRIQTFQTQREAAGREISGRQETLQRNAAFVQQQVGQALRPIIGQVMQQRGATLALDTGATLAHAPALDITDAVLAALNQRLTTLNVNAPPPQQQPAQQQQPQPQQRRPQGR
jgi:outer membrane protein